MEERAPCARRREHRGARGSSISGSGTPTRRRTVRAPLPGPLRALCFVVLALYPLGAGALLLSPDGWGVNRLNVRIWFSVTGALGIRDVVTPEEFAAVANVLLFIPVFAALATLLPRWWWIAVGAAISSTVEIYQLSLGSREPSIGDVLTNTLGAAIGTALGILVRRRPARRALSARTSASAASDPTGTTTPGGSRPATDHGPDGAPDDRD